MAQKEGQRHPGRGRGRSVALVLGALLVVAAVGGVTYAVVARDSSPGAAKSVSVQTTTTPQTTKTTTSIPAKPSAAGTKGTPAPRQSFDGRRLLAPECSPIKGPQWVYPVGPPVRGLPNVVA